LRHFYRRRVRPVVVGVMAASMAVSDPIPNGGTVAVGLGADDMVMATEAVEAVTVTVVDMATVAVTVTHLPAAVGHQPAGRCFLNQFII
jgi:hypothetical protein